MSELLLKDEVFAIIGAAMEVHSALGYGFLESVYHEALEFEMVDRRIPFKTQVPLVIRYKERVLTKQFVADLICFDGVIVELKAMDKLTSRDEAQLLNYLKATGYRVGILINFGVTGQLEWKRMVR
jgi:GxxExxY protein